MPDVAIIGAGASGLMCACRLVSLGITNIALFERNNKEGKKLLATGNGRCNLSNKNIDTSDYSTDDPNKLRAVLEAYGYEFTSKFFEKTLNVMLSGKDDLVYPRTYKSSTVVDAMRNFLEASGITITTDDMVKDISSIDAKYIVIATGGAASPKSGSDGNSYKLINSLINDRQAFTGVLPSLVQFRSSDSDVKSLSGVRVNCTLSMYVDNNEVATESGELLFTDYGISGICTMQLSRIYNEFIRKGIRNCYVSADMVPELSLDVLRDEVERRILNSDILDKADRLSGILQKEICEVILKRGGDIASHMKAFRINVSGTRDMENAQVTSGGLNLQYLGDGMRLTDNVYVIGEAVNVDGPCGGYNLQWAWSSAFSCAQDISSRISVL